MVFALLSSFTMVAQVSDSAATKDSLAVYRKLHDYAARSKLSYLLYGMLFRDMLDSGKTNHVHLQRPGDGYYKFQGKTIRRIRIIVVDPLGEPVNDTTVIADGLLNSVGNHLHVKTRQQTVRNLLLFKSGDAFDSLRVLESERILRLMPGIRDTKITPLPAGIHSDSVDMRVVVWDLWSAFVDGNISPGANTLKLGEYNFLGLAHTFQNSITYNAGDASNSFVTSGNYQLMNIRKTFISVNLFYSYSQLNKTAGLSFNRPFISPLTKWAGGATNVIISTQTTIATGTETHYATLAYHLHDVWLGRSFPLHKKTEGRYMSPRIIVTGRVFVTQYSQRPSALANPNSVLYMSGVGFCSRGYYKDADIYRSGLAIDVPEGRLLAFAGGYQKTEFYEQYYYSGRLAAGNHINHLGYVAAKLEYGAFYRNSINHDAVANMEVTYLTDPLDANKLSVRLYADLKATAGFWRNPAEGITLNDPYGLTGYYSPEQTSTAKTVLNTAAVVSLPYHAMGFRFAAMFFAGFGKLGNNISQIAGSRVYQAYGAGLLLRNDYLVFNTIQLFFYYYPIMPGTHPDSFQFNYSTTYSTSFMDFYLSEPDFVNYR